MAMAVAVVMAAVVDMVVVDMADGDSGLLSLS